MVALGPRKPNTPGHATLQVVPPQWTQGFAAHGDRVRRRFICRTNRIAPNFAAASGEKNHTEPQNGCEFFERRGQIAIQRSWFSLSGKLRTCGESDHRVTSMGRDFVKPALISLTIVATSKAEKVFLRGGFRPKSQRREGVWW